MHRSTHLTAAVMALTVLPALAGAQGTSARAAPRFVDGQAQIVPAFQDTTKWVFQDLWVESEFDTDHDGRKDRLHVDVVRPGVTGGMKVPVIYQSSPYFAGTAQTQVNWDVKTEVGATPPPRAPMKSPPFNAAGVPRSIRGDELVATWVPRGFAIVRSEASGTGLSQGCPTVGGDPERMAPKSVIDWLNGRARGFTTANGNEEVSATSWSTGKVGMIGTSYEGTLPLAAATTGVKGLEVVIPVSPNTSYYHYYRANGLIKSPGGYLGEDVDVLYDFIASGDTASRATCEKIWKNGIFAGRTGQDRATGAMNDFWLKRDLLLHVGGIKAAVLFAHGLNDYNVGSDHSIRIFNAMRARHLPVAIYLHTGGHGGNPPDATVNRWFSHYLYGVDNGVEKDPPVWIVQDAAMQAPEVLSAAHTIPAAPGWRRGFPIVLPTPFASFPVPGSVSVIFHPMAGGTAIGPLALNGASGGRETLVDDVEFTGSANASADASPHRLLYATATLTDTVHISGIPRVTLRIASSKPAANLSVWLVMLPYDSIPVGAASYQGVISRGWADIRKYKSLKTGGNFESTNRGEPLVPGKFYDVTFDLAPDDEFVPAGKRLAVMIMSSDREFTLWPQAGTALTLDLAHSSFSIPIVGGATAVGLAGGSNTNSQVDRNPPVAVRRPN